MLCGADGQMGGGGGRRTRFIGFASGDVAAVLTLTRSHTRPSWPARSLPSVSTQQCDKAARLHPAHMPLGEHSQADVSFAANNGAQKASSSRITSCIRVFPTAKQ